MCLLACLMLIAISPDARADEPPDRETLAGAVTAYLDAWHEAGRFHGCALVVHRGEVLASGAYGHANREWDIPNDLHTRFALQSISKQFTTVITLQLVDEGLLALDDTITDHLSWFRADTGSRITIDHLLRHMSGLPRYVQDGAPCDPAHPPFNWHNDYEPKDIVRNYMMCELRFEPGDRYEYNNSGYFLLALIIEQVTGRTWEENLRERLFEPLGMHETSIDRHERVIPFRAEGYVRSPRGLVRPSFENKRNLMGAGDVCSTVGDLRTWNEALTAGILLSPEMHALMMAPYAQSPGVAHAYSINHFAAELPGGRVTRYRGFSGGAPGFMTDAFTFPDSNLLVILLDNSSQYEHWRIAPGICAIVEGFEPEPPQRTISSWLARLAVTKGVDHALASYEKLRAENIDRYDTGNLESELNGLGYASLGADEFHDAVAVFELNVRLFPASWNVHDSLADAYEKLGRDELSREARATGEAIRTREDRLIGMLESGDFDGAIAVVQSARASLPHDVAIFTPSRIGPLFGRAFQSGEHDRARRICAVWAEGNPGTVGPWFSMLRVHQRTGDGVGEATCCRTILELAPDHPRAADLRTRLAQLEEEN
jgi:CubicO group peptidase (beta-lactamase class C family)